MLNYIIFILYFYIKLYYIILYYIILYYILYYIILYIIYIELYIELYYIILYYIILYYIILYYILYYIILYMGLSCFSFPCWTEGCLKPKELVNMHTYCYRATPLCQKVWQCPFPSNITWRPLFSSTGMSFQSRLWRQPFQWYGIGLLPYFTTYPVPRQTSQH